MLQEAVLVSSASKVPEYCVLCILIHHLFWKPQPIKESLNMEPKGPKVDILFGSGIVGPFIASKHLTKPVQSFPYQKTTV